MDKNLLNWYINNGNKLAFMEVKGNFSTFLIAVNNTVANICYPVHGIEIVPLYLRNDSPQLLRKFHDTDLWCHLLNQERINRTM